MNPYEEFVHGSFTKTFKNRRLRHLKTLKEFAHYIVHHPTEFSKLTLKRARFYVNLIEHSKGGAIHSEDLQKLLHSSYNPMMGDVHGYTLDTDLSNDTGKVYSKDGQTYIIHKGTQGASDWLNNLALAYSPSLYKMTSRYKKGKELQEKALQKYSGNKIDVLGHSQGSALSELISKGDKRVNNVITYNRPVLLRDLFQNPDHNLYDVRTSADIVSALLPFQRGTRTTTISSPTWNALEEHKTPALNRIHQILGSGF
jgi:hypothetical protein